MRGIIVGLAALVSVLAACSGSGDGKSGNGGGGGIANGGSGGATGGSGGTVAVTNCPGPANAVPTFWVKNVTNPTVDMTLQAVVNSNRPRNASDLPHGDFILSMQNRADATNTVQFFYTVPSNFRIPETVAIADKVVFHFHRDRPGTTNLDEWAELRTDDGHLIWAAAALHASVPTIGFVGPAGFPDLVVVPPTTGPVCLDPAPTCGARARFAPTVDMALGPLPAMPGNGVDLTGPRDSGTMLVTEYMTQTDKTGCSEENPAVGWVFIGQRNGDEEATPPCGGTTQCTTGEYCDDHADTCALEESGGSCRRYFDSDPGSPKACGCDGTVYDNARAAAKAGFDLQSADSCAKPDGTFGCGSYFCALDKQCVGRDLGYCDRLPGCTGAADCGCLTFDANCTCTGDAASGITVVCH